MATITSNTLFSIDKKLLASQDSMEIDSLDSLSPAAIAAATETICCYRA